jgi:2-polyprenyl-3-methyl-5-hydroxy-6-metoxy-1,4-benzoquinol methylase
MAASSTPEAAPAIETSAMENCPLCGHAGILQHEGLIDRLYGAPGRWSIRRCPNPRCGLGWLDPQPIEHDVSKLYQNYYTHGGNEPNGQLSSRRKRFLKEAAAVLIPWRRHAFRSDSRYIIGRVPGRLLDVGCGTGDFLAGMAAHGWDASGVEFDAEAVAVARLHAGVRVHTGRLSDQRFPLSSFDAITLSNVIEHLPNPDRVFAELRRVLAPGGRIAMITPNINSLGHRAFGRCWRGLETPRHLYLFNATTLRALAERAGLEVEACFTAPGDPSILTASLELWNRRPRKAAAPKIGRLTWRETVGTLFNSEVGEFVVLLATK